MAQILMIVGSALVAGSGLFYLVKGKPMKKRDGTELSMNATRLLSIACLIGGAAALVYALTMR
jgi:hypothetical protein